ncbi:MAG: rhodanese-like domain-containing protein [Calditrichaceae bacterium]
MKNLLAVTVILFSVFSTSNLMAKDGFPGRAEYPEIPVYSKTDLARDFNNVVIVDARSSLEFDTLRIKGAINIPVASKDFAKRVKALRRQDKKNIVFYCNGRTCYKSYKAAKAAIKAGVRNVFAYDAGMFEWAQSYPQHAELLGHSPVDPKQIISRNTFKQRILDPKTFTETVRSTPRSQTMIMDVRDMYQRAGVGFFPGMEKWVSLDDRQKLARYLKKAREQNKTLYIYDEAGKQVRWLQYTLERENIKNYYFMHQGARGFTRTFIN